MSSSSRPHFGSWSSLVSLCTVSLFHTFPISRPVFVRSFLTCLIYPGCVLPFNNISSSLLLERDFFKVPPDHCTLTIPNQCQSSANPPYNCPSSDSYQPPLPVNITINDKYYSKLESSDIDCGDDDWSKGCTKVEEHSPPSV
jgi:hypothetical protein